MLAKSWKKILLFILIIACLWNIISKIVYKVSFESVIKGFQENYQQEETTNQIN